MPTALATFLAAHSCGASDTATHTRIGSKALKIPGGKYCIPDDKLPEFYRTYAKHVLAGKRFEYLTEVQRDIGPLLVDLDFRYETAVESRQHDSGLVEDVLQLYADVLSDILDLEPGTNVLMCVFEKPHANVCDTRTKDGIHLTVDLPLDRATRVLVRDAVIPEIGPILEGLPLVNTVEEVLDAGISRSHTNWQLYGSRKPGNEAYEVTHATTWIVAEDRRLERQPESTVSLSSEAMEGLLARVSARGGGIRPAGACPVSDAWTERHASVGRPAAAGPAAHQTPSSELALVCADDQLSGNTEIDAALQAYLDRLGDAQYELREAVGYTMCLGEEHYAPHDAWFKVGQALHHTSPTLFVAWMAFSAKSPSFDASQVAQHRSRWQSMGRKVGAQTTVRSLMYWARTSNPAGYSSVQKASVGHYIQETLKGPTEYDIGMVLYQVFKDSFRCVSIKTKQWYQYINHRWTECDSGHALRQKMSSWLAKEYLKKTSETVDALVALDPKSDDATRLMKLSSKYSEIALRLKNTVFKDHVMRECCELFYDGEFLGSLDQDGQLLCFKNGVYDFREGCFRDGRPEDYISLCTHIAYQPVAECDPTVRKDVERFWEQLFPDEDLRAHMWDHGASVLIGENENQTFSIYVGPGSNGKSKFVELLSEGLGDYKGTVPITLVMGSRPTIGSVSPEVAQLKGKRYAVMQEPTKGDRINEGIMKELTGGDPVQGRQLYQKTVTFIPQFTLGVCTNNLPTFNSNDEGTWRRVRLCRFKAGFASPEELEEKKKEYPEVKHWHLKDKKLKSKFAAWAPVLMSMLVARAQQTQGLVADCEAVLQESRKYRNEQNHLVEFCEERLREAKGQSLTITTAWMDFQEWFRDVHPRERMPKRKELEQHLTKKMGAPAQAGGSHKRREWEGFTTAEAPVMDDYDE
jgi:P4 family phage/plasmid primase-like protien